MSQETGRGGDEIERRGLLAATAGGMMALAAVPAPAAAQGMPAGIGPLTPPRIADEFELKRIPALLEISVDNRDWAAARSYFADSVRVDFTSLGGGQAAVIPSDALIAGWSSNLKGDKTSFHMRGETIVNVADDRATLVSNGYAWNRKPGGPGGELWEVWGRYIHELARTPQGWKIVGFTLHVTLQRGSDWVRDTPGA